MANGVVYYLMIFSVTAILLIEGAVLPLHRLSSISILSIPQISKHNFEFFIAVCLLTW